MPGTNSIVLPTDINTTLPETEALWTVEEVARFLRLTPETIRSMAREGKLKAVKVHRGWRFRRQDLPGIQD